MDIPAYIKSHVSILDAISHYLEPKKVGARLFVSCPGHSDSTPSLAIDAEKDLWHCFSCGKGGDCIAFVRMIEQTTFLEACRILVANHSIPAPRRLQRRLMREKLASLEANGQRVEALAIVDELSRFSD